MVAGRRWANSRRHDLAYGEDYKAALRARNALYFARLFKSRGVSHIHVHFANRATHTALFIKKLGIPFSFTAHAQDFIVDLGSSGPARRDVPRGRVRHRRLGL